MPKTLLIYYRPLVPLLRFTLLFRIASPPTLMRSAIFSRLAAIQFPLVFQNSVSRPLQHHSVFETQRLPSSAAFGSLRLFTVNSHTDHQNNEETMTDSSNTDKRPEEYTPPKVWTHNPGNGGKFANVNRPTSGATHDKELPVGEHPLQLYSLATPNGIKATIMLEELLELGVTEAEYDAWLIKIDGAQFGSGFVKINPNSKIPAMMDHAPAGGGDPVRIFESGSILMYLGDKFCKLLPPISDVRKRTECVNWLMWQMGSAPFLGGGFGHFYAYAPYKMEYPINRYAMETKRQLDVLDTHLANQEYMIGDEYTIADIAVWSWYGQLALGDLYSSYEFLDIPSYPNLIRWAKKIAERPAVKRGKMVNKVWGEPETQLWERHDKSDFELETQDKKEAKERNEEKKETDGGRAPKRISENM